MILSQDGKMNVLVKGLNGSSDAKKIYEFDQVIKKRRERERDRECERDREWERKKETER